MKALILIFALNILHISGYNQVTEVPISKIDLLKVNELRCIDKWGDLSEVCSLGLDGFSVVFFNTYLDTLSKQIRLIGRVCTSAEINTGGLSDIEVFEAIKEKNTIQNRKLLGRTTYDKEYVYNDGFFDVILDISKMKSLFFYGKGYFVKEFKIGKLIE